MTHMTLKKYAHTQNSYSKSMVNLYMLKLGTIKLASKLKLIIVS